MGIFDRLGDVIRSYLNDEDDRIFGRPRGGDPDIEEAEAELESFLRGEGPRPGTGDWGGTAGRGNSAGNRAGGGAWGGTGSWTRSGGDPGGDWGGAWRNGGNGSRGNSGADWSGSETRREKTAPNMPPKEPEQLRQDFAELGLPFGAGAEECKAAYRRLLKLHHPDRHAGHQGNMEKATKKMAKINAAYDRIEKWRGEGKG